MDRPAGQLDLLERIRSSEKRVVVLTGPAACGKTAAAIDLADAYRPADGAPQCLLLAPNSPTVAQLARRLLAGHAQAAVFAPQVITFASLADKLLADCPPADGPARGRMLSPFARRITLRQIIDELTAAGRLPAFVAVADTPGLVTAVDSAIAELKRAAIEPDALARVAKAGPTADLLPVYRQYQAHLQQANGYDVEGQMWLARDALAAAIAAGRTPATLADIRAIAVDGFTDFTPTQLEMLRLIGGIVEKLVITLPIGDDGRDRLWRWTKLTLTSVRNAFDDDVDVLALSPPARSGAGMLWPSAFDYDAPKAPCPPQVQLLSAAGKQQEVAAVARRVKRLLLDGAQPGRIAVLARTMSEYRPTIDRAFAACDIPIAADSCPVTDVPAVRFALSAARLGPQFDATDVLAVIANSYFRPQAIGDFDDRSVAAAQLLIRQGGVLTGRQAYAHAAERLIRRLPSAPAAQDEALADDDGPIAPGELLRHADTITQAADMLAALFDVVSGDLPSVIAALQLPQAACDQDDPVRIARDLRGLAAVESALAELPAAPPPAHLYEAMSAVTCRPGRTESLVDVLSVLDARALRYDHVFLLGLSEGQFPRSFTDGPLLGERHRKRWADQGVHLNARDDLTAREMLLFYLAASRTDDTLTLTVLSSDAAGKPSAPSPFLTALLAPADGLDAAVTERIPLGQYVGLGEQLSSPGETMSAAFAGLFARDGSPTPGAVSWAIAEANDAMTLATRGVFAEASRWRPGQAGPFDGRITDPALTATLADQYPEHVVFSASRLECFARCPWLYFAKYVLHLPEPDPPAARLDAARRGSLCHDALFGLMTNLVNAHGRPVRLNEIDADQLTAATDDALAQAARRDEARWPTAYPTLRQVQLDRLAEHLRRYMLAQRSQADQFGAECLHFELAFGLPVAGDDLTDPASQGEPITLDCPAGPIRLRGKIDRVDAVAAGEHVGLLVVDYKTGALPSAKDIPAGLRVQIPLYAAVAAKLLGRSALGGAYHHVGPAEKSLLFAAYKVSRSGTAAANDKYADHTAEAIRHVGEYVTAMSTGRFDMPTEVDCPSWCAFGQICQHSKPRAMIRAGDGGCP